MFTGRNSLRRLVGLGILAFGIGAGLFPAATYAIVNPKYQPKKHLFDPSNYCLACRVVKKDWASRTIQLEVTQVMKGDFPGKTVTMTAASDELEGDFVGLRQGQTVVAYIGGPIRALQRRVLFYTGGGRWQLGELKDVQDVVHWSWTQDADKGRDNEEIMFGTFSGDVDRLAEMMADAAAGTMYFPSIPFESFQEDKVVAKFGKAVRGVALYDINGDGKLDIYACSKAGSRAFLQAGPVEFTDSTDALGLAGIQSQSCGFADANADGRADLLADGVIYLQGADGKFTRSDLLPAEANEQVRSAAFVDVNGDGYPDVVVSRLKAGLRVYTNPGAQGGDFTDATAACGLDRPENGADGDGYFDAGDWNDDGRIDLFYATPEGLLLVQDAAGQFTVAGVAVRNVADDPDEARLAAPAFGAIWRPDRLSVIAPGANCFYLLADVRGVPEDVAGYGNETSEPAYDQWMALAEDLNADGTVDFYTTTRMATEKAVFLSNRGYGSFMRPEKYAGNGKVFPSDAYNSGAAGLAAGDVDGDGANDLLNGGVDGTLSLLINDTLNQRKPIEHPSYHEQKLLQTKIVTVHVRGRTGVVGATVRFTDADGRTVALRQIGTNIGTGCRGPDTANVALREPGRYTVTVRFSDGKIWTSPVDLTETSKTCVKLVADREQARDKAAG